MSNELLGPWPEALTKEAQQSGVGTTCLKCIMIPSSDDTGLLHKVNHKHHPKEPSSFIDWLRQVDPNMKQNYAAADRKTEQICPKDPPDGPEMGTFPHMGLY